jgi:hypothetical protein
MIVIFALKSKIPRRFRESQPNLLQTLPPYFLADRYQTATQATGRLKYLATSLGTLKDTDFANWKLLVASAKFGK